MALDLDGVMVSAGAACSSGKVKASPVLTAMGYEGLADQALRVSGGWASVEADWTRFTDVWLAAYARRATRRRASAA
jgi:cysteine desulfurase